MSIETLLRSALQQKINPDRIHTYRQPILEADLALAKPAAVLVMLMQQSGEWSILLTERSQILSHHAGQISCVGGLADTQDANLYETALREANEEVGMPRSAATKMGQLHQHLIARRFLVTPYVAMVTAFDIKPQADEVATIFHLPLSFLLDDRHCQQDIRGDHYRGYQLHFQQFHIWGGTAAILLDLKDIIKNDAEIFAAFCRP